MASSVSRASRISGLPILKFIDKGLRDIPENAIIVVLTTCQGTWNTSEFGRSLKLSYPLAYHEYMELCQSKEANKLAGTCHIIPPQRADSLASGLPPTHIACLFASYGDGNRNYLSRHKPGRDSKERVRDQIESALKQLREELSISGHVAEVKRAWTPAGSASAWTADPSANWGMLGRGMKIYISQDNGHDFQMSWSEVESLIRRYFCLWEGVWFVWMKLV